MGRGRKSQEEGRKGGPLLPEEKLKGSRGREEGVGARHGKRGGGYITAKVDKRRSYSADGWTVKRGIPIGKGTDATVSRGRGGEKPYWGRKENLHPSKGPATGKGNFRPNAS